MDFCSICNRKGDREYWPNCANCFAPVCNNHPTPQCQCAIFCEECQDHDVHAKSDDDEDD